MEPVVHDRFRHRNERLAGLQLDPPAVVEVLTETHETFVEPTHRFVHAATDCEHASRRVGQEATVPPVDGAVGHAAVGLDVHRAVQPLHVASRADEAVLVEGALQRRAPAVVHDVVGVAEQDVVAAGGPRADVAGAGRAVRTLARADHVHREPAVILPQDGGRGVGRAVVHDDDLPRAAEGLPRQRVELLTNGRRGVSTGDHDADLHVVAALDQVITHPAGVVRRRARRRRSTHRPPTRRRWRRGAWRCRQRRSPSRRGPRRCAGRRRTAGAGSRAACD